MRTFLKSRVLLPCLSMYVAFANPVQAENLLTITAFGDSLTQGYGLPEADGLVPQLQNWLNENGQNVRIINAGVSGDTTAGGAARIDWTLAEPTDAVLLALGGNDLLRGLSPTESKENLRAILRSLEEQEVPVLMIGFRAPLNYGETYKLEFDAMYPELADAFSVPLFPFFFEGLGVGEDPAAMIAFMQADATHPNAEGVGLIVDALGPAILEFLTELGTS